VIEVHLLIDSLLKIVFVCQYLRTILAVRVVSGLKTVIQRSRVRQTTQSQVQSAILSKRKYPPCVVNCKSLLIHRSFLYAPNVLIPTNIKDKEEFIVFFLSV